MPCCCLLFDFFTFRCCWRSCFYSRCSRFEVVFCAVRRSISVVLFLLQRRVFIGIVDVVGLSVVDLLRFLFAAFACTSLSNGTSASLVYRLFDFSFKITILPLHSSFDIPLVYAVACLRFIADYSDICLVARLSSDWFFFLQQISICFSDRIDTYSTQFLKNDLCKNICTALTHT